MVQAQARPAFLEVDLTAAQGVALRRSSRKNRREDCGGCGLAVRVSVALAMGAGTAFYRRGDQACFCRRMHQVSFSLTDREKRSRTLYLVRWRGIDRLAQVRCPKALPPSLRGGTSYLARSHRRNRAGHGPAGFAATTPLAWVSGKPLDFAPSTAATVMTCSRPIGLRRTSAAPEATRLPALASRPVLRSTGPPHARCSN